MRGLVVTFVTLVTLVMLGGLATAQAIASPPPPPEDHASEERPALEWSTWVRAGMGMKPREVTSAARTVGTPPERSGQDTTYELALGGDLTIGLARGESVRVGPWFEIRDVRNVPFVGGELVIQRAPKKIDMFLYDGQGVLYLRAGGNPDHVTGQIAYGYLAPWDLFGKSKGGDTRYMIGVRLVASVTRGTADPGDWVATFGLEAEPVGALRYLLGIRDWY